VAVRGTDPLMEAGGAVMEVHMERGAMGRVTVQGRLAGEREAVRRRTRKACCHGVAGRGFESPDSLVGALFHLI
jgi:hypothetical protein